MLILLAMFATMMSCDKPAYSYPDIVPFDLHATNHDDDPEGWGKAYGDACEAAEKAVVT